MNVLFLCSWYPNAELPFNGNFIQQHARAVAKNENIAVLNIQSRIQKNKFEIESKKNENVFEVIVYYKRTKNKQIINYPIFFIRHIGSLKIGFNFIKEYYKYPIDIVHLNVILPLGWFALFLKKKFNIPYIVTEHHTRYLYNKEKSFNYFEQFIVKKIVKNAEFVCPVSNNLKESFIKRGFAGNFEVVENVVNDSIFFVKNKKPKNRINLLHVSSFNEDQKNVSGIINVFNKLSKKYNIYIRIIGDGDKNKVIEYAKNIGLSDLLYSVEGPFNSDEIAESMRQADIFILFSNYENLPCVIAESLVCGTPVVATDVGGISEMINKHNGLLVKSKDEDDLYRKISQMIDNLDTYNSNFISEEAKNKYAYSIIANKFSDLYRQALITKN